MSTQQKKDRRPPAPARAATSRSTSRTSKPRRRRAAKKKTQAQRADKYELYQASVQDAPHEVRMLRRFFQDVHGKDQEPSTLREDFSGTAWISCAWVNRKPHRRAYAVDLEPETHEWGRARNLVELPRSDRERVTYVVGDVRDTGNTPRVDVIAAMNFSYFIFKTRVELLRYFRAAYDNLAEGGIFALDCFGGSEVFEDSREESTKLEGFRYIWDQDVLDPITHHYTFHIHFAFPDGSRIERAFTYDWRLWTLPEIQEVLVEAGFDAPSVYWEDATDSGEGTGRYRIRTRGTADKAWIAYIVGVKRGARAGVKGSRSRAARR